MLKDPRTRWEHGLFPYDALSHAGIGPDSRIQDIQDAVFVLAKQGMWGRDKSAARDQLATPARRLKVDFFLYSMGLEDLLAALARVVPGLADEAGGDELGARMAADFRPVDTADVLVAPVVDLEPEGDPADAVEFDW
jgi:hypothetical protein